MNEGRARRDTQSKCWLKTELERGSKVRLQVRSWQGSEGRDAGRDGRDERKVDLYYKSSR